MAEAWEQFPDHMARWLAGDEAGIPGSESSMAAGERFTVALHEHLETLGPDDTLVVVSHGGVTRAGTFSFLGLPRETWESFSGLSNCSWTVLEERDAEIPQLFASLRLGRYSQAHGGASSSGMPARSPSPSCLMRSRPASSSRARSSRRPWVTPLGVDRHRISITINTWSACHNIDGNQCLERSAAAMSVPMAPMPARTPKASGNPPGNRAKPAPRNGATAAAAIRGPLKTPLSRA